MATTTTVRTQALNVSTSFAQAGLVFDDATRLLVGGLWQNAVMESNQTGTTARAAAIRPRVATIRRGPTITTITASSMCGITCSR